MLTVLDEPSLGETNEMDIRYGKWQVLHELGRGGQGIVYKVEDAERSELFLKWLRNVILQIQGPILESQQRSVAVQLNHDLQRRLVHNPNQYGALKVLIDPGDHGADVEKAKKRLQQEIEVIAKLKHAHLIKVLDYDNGGSWIVYKYYEKGSLARHIDRFKGQPLEATQAFVGLVAGVAALHQAGIVHRDIKPDNLFLEDDGTLVLGDFGLVHVGDGHRVTATDEKVGTTDYMPTWAIGEQRLDRLKPTFDVFSLGKILWAMISGDRFLRVHYVLEPEFDLTKRFPGAPRMKLVNELLAKCIVEREPDCLATAEELLAETRELLRDLEGSMPEVCPICNQVNWEQLIEPPKIFHTPMITLVCNRCGFVRKFASEVPGLPSWVKKVTKIRPERI